MYKRHRHFEQIFWQEFSHILNILLNQNSILILKIVYIVLVKIKPTTTEYKKNEIKFTFLEFGSEATENLITFTVV